MTGVASTQERWVRAFVMLYLEVEVGLRPARHLRPLMALELQPVVGNCGRQGPMPEVLGVRLQSRRGACEAVVLLQEQDRVSALAIAVRREEMGWRVAEVRRPDEPPRPALAPTETDPRTPITWHELSADASCPTWGVPSGWQPSQPQRPARAA